MASPEKILTLILTDCRLMFNRILLKKNEDCDVDFEAVYICAWTPEAMQYKCCIFVSFEPHRYYL